MARKAANRNVRVSLQFICQELLHAACMERTHACQEHHAGRRLDFGALAQLCSGTEQAQAAVLERLHGSLEAKARRNMGAGVGEQGLLTHLRDSTTSKGFATHPSLALLMLLRFPGERRGRWRPCHCHCPLHPRRACAPCTARPAAPSASACSR